MLNKVILVGRLTRDPEVTCTPAGKTITKFDIAVDRPKFGDKQETDFIHIVTFGKNAENCGNYISKGRLVAIDGRLQIRSYEANDGTKRKATEVIAESVKFLDREKEQGNTTKNISSDIFPDDNIPF